MSNGQSDSQPGFHRIDSTTGVAGPDAEVDREVRRIFWELGVAHSAIAELCRSYATDSHGLTNDQQTAQLLAISEKLGALRDQVERTRLAARDFALEKMNRLPTT